MKVLLHIKNWSYIISTFFFFGLFYSCERNESKTPQPTLQFEETSRKIDTITQTDENLKFEIVFENSDLFLDINLETESCMLSAWGESIKTDFNYTYDTDLDSSLDAIKVLRSNIGNDIIVLLPTFTEEFLTCQVIKIERDNKSFKKGIFEINIHKYNNVPQFYLNNMMKLTPNKDHFEIALGDFKYEQDFSNVDN